MAWGQVSRGVRFTGHVSTFIVAANNSSGRNKIRADYVCTGSNDEVIINQALNALPSAGGYVHLLEGTYSISNTITIPADNITLAGSGKGTRINTTSDISMISATSLTGILIADLYLYGAGHLNVNNMGIQFKTVYSSRITGCWLDNMFIGIECNQLVPSYYVTIDNNRGENCGWVIFFNGHNIITNNVCNDSTFGMHITGGASATPLGGVIVANNLCYSNDFSGIMVTGSDYALTIISGNICIGNGSHGIRFTLLQNSTMVGNICESNQGHGIFVERSSSNSITGNICTDNDSGATATYDGIIVDNNSDNNVVSSNRCTGNDRDGIRIDDNTCNRNIVTGNHCIGNTGAAITDNGTNTHPNGASGTTNLALDDLNIIA